MEKEIYLVGYGMNFNEDRTISADTSIKCADIIFTIEPDISHIKEYLSVEAPVENLFHFYKKGQLRSDVYKIISEHIITSLKKYSKVVLLVPGNPLFLDTVCELIEERAFELDIDLHIIEGISSLDAINNQLEIPLHKTSITVYIADIFCNRKPNIDIDTVLLLFQPGNVSSNTVAIGTVSKKSVLILQESLLEYYSPEDNWMLINLGNSSDNPTKIIWNNIKNLHLFVNYMHSGTLIVSKNWWPDILKDTKPTIVEGLS